MADLPEVGAEAVLIHDKYDAAIAEAIRKADEFDERMNSLSGEILATIDVDTSELDNIEAPDVIVDVSVDDTEVTDELEQIEAPDIEAEVTADVDEAEQSLLDLEAEAPAIEGTATIDDSDAEQTLSDLDETDVEPEVDPKMTDEGKQVANDVKFLASMKKIEIAIDFGQKAFDFITKVGEVTVGPLLDVEDAVARINAQTGEAIPGLDEMVKSIRFDDLGDSVDQIADVIIQAKALGAPIDEATRAALTFTHTWRDQDPSETLKTLNALVGSGLAKNFAEAGDLMTVAMQNGANKGNDLLAVVQANSQSWADMGLNGAQAMATITSLQNAGVDSASDAAKMVQTFDDALTAAAADPNSQQAKLLKLMGIDNPKDAGEAIGAETLDGFVEAFKNLPTDQQDLVSGTFFGKGGKKFTGAIEGLETESDPFKDMKDAAEDAATEIDNTLRGAIDDFVLKINEKVSELLSSESLDIPDKIEDMKKGLQDALDVIASGGTVGEALEVALNIPGFNDSVNRFEASIGNFVISVLEIIASVQDFLGKDSSGTRRQITQAEREQLPFNLKVANADELAGEIQTAVDRGLSTSDIKKATDTALGEMLAGGQLDKAQALVDGLKDVQAGPPIINPDVSGTGRQEAQVALRMAENGDTSRLQEQIDKGNLIAPVSIDMTDWQAQIDEAEAKLEEAKLNFGPNPATASPLGPLGAEQGAGTSPFLGAVVPGGDKAGGMFGTAIQAFDDVMTKSGDAQTKTEESTAAMASAWSDLDLNLDEKSQTIIEHIDNVAAQTEDADARIGTALTGNTVTESFAAVLTAAEESFPAAGQFALDLINDIVELDAVGSSRIGHLSKGLHDLQFLSAAVVQGVKDALALGANLPGAGGAGGGSTTNNTNTTVTVINTPSNGAQVASDQYGLARSLGGR